MADVTPTYLRCEYLRNPLAIDAEQPRLSWTLTSDQRSVKQTAYQILAAGSQAVLDQNQGDLWDSGRITSDRTAHVPYSGKALGRIKLREPILIPPVVADQTLYILTDDGMLHAYR